LLLGSRPPIQVLTNAEDFQRAMAQPLLAKTPHFALHHLAGAVQRRCGAARGGSLSSGPTAEGAEPVDNPLENPVDKWVDGMSQAAWAGYVVPKRHARRSVTRNLIRRQMRQVLADQQSGPEGLPTGIWVLRLRQGFEVAQFPSAASNPLRQAVREELRLVVGTALKRLASRVARP
jgi:ribonuclease P protein component